LHTLTQRDPYTITPIVRAYVFESNEPRRIKPDRGPFSTEPNGRRRAKQYADNTSSGPSLVKFGEPANMAAQPKLGLLPERRLGRGRNSASRTFASWKNLELPARA
jgi:hypothetical protein